MPIEDDDYRGILGADEDDYEERSGNDAGEYTGPGDENALTDGMNDVRRRDAMRSSGLNSFDEGISGSVVGWLTGADGRVAAANARAEEANRLAMWERLGEYAPTADDLSVEYGNEDAIAGLGSEWSRDTEEAQAGRGAMADSMDALNEWARGGFTDADRAMMDETARNEAMGARADREAALSSLEARGMGGGGSALAADLMAGEGAAARASSRNTTMLGSAQARAMEANAARGALGGAMRDMDARERSGREAYNMYDTGYYRGREDRNTDRENQTRESAADAAQQEYQNRVDRTAGYDGQYSTDVNRRLREGERSDENNRGFLESIGELFG
jgi:hypothetical protein